VVVDGRGVDLCITLSLRRAMDSLVTVASKNLHRDGGRRPWHVYLWRHFPGIGGLLQVEGPKARRTVAIFSTIAQDPCRLARALGSL
jgi:hypothetical protein